MAVARCRFCFAKVVFFGDLCGACDDVDRFVNVVARSDELALAGRAADAEMGDL